MRFLTRFLEFFLVRVSVDCPTLCRTFCSGGAQALCGTFPVLGGVWRRPMSEALPELCGTFRTGGAEFYAARALAPEPGGPREEPARLVSLESGSSWSDGRRACPPQSAHHAATIPLLARTQIVGTHPQRLLSRKKWKHLNKCSKTEILREFESLQ